MQKTLERDIKTIGTGCLPAGQAGKPVPAYNSISFQCFFIAYTYSCFKSESR